MCLDKVAGTEVLKKDLKVKKLVEVDSLEPDVFYFGIGLGYRSEVKKGLNTAGYQEEIASAKDGDYKCGFHCYPLNRSLVSIKKDWMSPYDTYVIIYCAIPKGTEIVRGKTKHGSAIVTPKLIYGGKYLEM